MFCLIETITFYLPGIIWFYYVLNDEICNTPLEEDLSIIINCYFVISIIIFVPILFPCCYLEEPDCILFYWILYIIGKIAIIIVMLCYVQTDLFQKWDNELCPNLYNLGIFWIVWNYIQLVYSAVVTVLIICRCCC